MLISVVTPLYRSAPYIEELHRRCVAAIAAAGATAHEIIFINDASPDDSLAIAKRIADRDPGVVVVDLSRNFGQHRAIMTGLAMAKGDFVFVMDSDLEEDPEWISMFYRELMRAGCDVVYGVQQGRKGGAPYLLGRRMFYKALNWLSSAQFPENVVTARIMSRRYVDALMTFEERELFLAGIWHMTGFAQMPIEVHKHDSSPTTYSLAGLAAMFINGVTSFSTRPLLFISVSGIAVSFVAFAFTAWIAARQLIYHIAIPGWASVMSVTLLIGGMSLFFNGVIAIYVAKIFLEVKRRPMTIVRDVYSQGARGESKPPA